MIPSRKTRSCNKKRRKSPRKSSPKRAKNTTSFICSGCNISFDHNKKLLDHKKRSDNPDCKSDLVKCEFCGALALNEYGISVHQRSDMDCINRQIAIDNTNVVLHNAEDGPLSKNQQQLSYNEEPFEDSGLLEIYGDDAGKFTTRKRMTENGKKSTSLSSDTHE